MSHTETMTRNGRPVDVKIIDLGNVPRHDELGNVYEALVSQFHCEGKCLGECPTDLRIVESRGLLARIENDTAFLASLGITWSEYGPDAIEGLIKEIIRLVHHLPKESWRRVRFAVSADEYVQLRDYCLARDGRFHGRIKDIPLVIEPEPDYPVFWSQLGK